MYKKNFLLILVSLIPAFLQAQSAQTGDTALLDLIQKAHLNSEEITAADAAIKQAEEQVTIARKAWYPQNPNISANMNLLGWNNTTSKTPGVGQSRTITKNYIQSPTSINPTTTITLYNGGANIAALNKAEAQLETAKAARIKAEQDILAQTIKAYIDLYVAEQGLKFNESNLHVVGQHKEASHIRYEAGDANLTDVNLSLGRHEKALSDYASAKAQYDNAQTAMERVIQEQYAGPYPLPTTLSYLPQSFDEGLQAALTTNPDILTKKYAVQTAQTDVATAEAADLPTLALQLGTTLTWKGAGGSWSKVSGAGEQGWKYARPSTTSGFQAGAALQGSWTLDWLGTNSAGIRSAKDGVASAVATQVNTGKEVKKGIESAWSNWQAARENVTRLKARAVAQEDAVEGFRAEQEAGSRTMLELLDAEQENLQAKLDHVNAQGQEVLARFELLQLMGLLTVDYLASNIPSSTSDAVGTMLDASAIAPQEYNANEEFVVAAEEVEHASPL